MLPDLSHLSLHDIGYGWMTDLPLLLAAACLIVALAVYARRVRQPWRR